ncbi:MAG TPA: MOSC domain-containing protein [Gemmatimonadota bacterium]|nr:MOSC domain-containing protein [Gemmatimonadota bacterium]
MSATVAGLFVYPVKSMSGIAVDQVDLDALGFPHDRRWMTTDAEGHFLTQRVLPRLALVRTAIEGDRLRLSADGAALELPLVPPAGPTEPVRVWRDDVGAVPAGEDSDRWISDFLGLPARIFGFPPAAVRPAKRDPGGRGARIGFADAYPGLLISEESLEDLNGRLEEPLEMNRFRPNLVVRGAGPFAEDGWRRVRAGEVEFDVAGPCARCATTTVDQATGERGKEPLRTLATFRREGSEVMFGQNVVHAAPGRIRLGDPVEILA